MGNCLRRDDSAARWAGEEWDFLAADARGRRAKLMDEDEIDEGLLGCGSTAATVKIKITKKQLEELLGKVDIKELSVQQVLTQLISVGDQFHDSRHRSWRPVLQSIPEVD